MGSRLNPRLHERRRRGHPGGTVASHTKHSIYLRARGKALRLNRLSLVRRVLNLYNYGSGSKKALAIRLTIGLVVCLALGWLVSRGVSWEEVWQSFRDLPLHLLALALVVFLLSNVARAYRWQVLFIDERISVRRLFLIENMGLGLNNVLPVRIASEATQLALLIFRDGISRGTALATLGMTRIMDVWASTLLLALGLFLVPGGGQLGRYAAGGIVFSFLLLVLVRFMAWGSRGIPFVERFPVLRTFAVSLAQLERNKARMLVSMIASLSQWGILGVSGWIIALGMNVDLSLAEAVLLILATIFVATSIPTTPGAIGVFEAAMVYIMGFFDIEKSLALPYAITMHAILFVPPTLFAAVFLPREGLGSLGQMRARTQALMNLPPDTNQ